MIELKDISKTYKTGQIGVRALHNVSLKVSAGEFIAILADLLPGVKSTIGNSNVSNGTPEHLRGILNRTYMVMLGRQGLYSTICDVLDPEQVAISRGERQNIVDLIYRVMDDIDIPMASLSKDEIDYVKTAKVLMGRTLYSHAWLEM